MVSTQCRRIQYHRDHEPLKPRPRARASALFHPSLVDARGSLSSCARLSSSDLVDGAVDGASASCDACQVQRRRLSSAPAKLTRRPSPRLPAPHCKTTRPTQLNGGKNVGSRERGAATFVEQCGDAGATGSPERLYLSRIAITHIVAAKLNVPLAHAKAASSLRRDSLGH